MIETFYKDNPHRITGFRSDPRAVHTCGSNWMMIYKTVSNLKHENRNSLNLVILRGYEQSMN
jgi:hypothetical protein